MAIISRGILGSIRGTVGTVTGSSWKGVDYIRMRSGERTKAPSQLQKEQQAKFQLMVRFLQSVFSMVMLGFKNYAIKQTGFNAAMSYNLKNAVSGTYPDFMIDYPSVLISKGELPGPLNPQAVSDSEGTVTFTWSNNSGIGKAKAGDKALLLVYCPEMNLAIYTDAGAPRSASTQTLQVSQFAGQVVQTYIGFVSEDGKDLATSIFTGQLSVL